MNKKLNRYIIFWLSQTLSQLGSSMTGFALILWVYTQNNSALTVSLMSFCNYVPNILASIFAGAFVDRHSKKAVMLIADTIAALGSIAILFFYAVNGLQFWHIYAVNGIVGLTNAFQSPASQVAVGRMVPKELLERVNGLNSFSGSLTTVLTPILAAALFGLGDLKVVLTFDVCSFVFAFLVLLIIIYIPEYDTSVAKRETIFEGYAEGFRFLRANRVILMIVVTMAVMNFFSRLTYENILSPMILAKSGNNSMALGIVNAAMGIGGIVGGIFVSVKGLSKDKVRLIYLSAAVSFLLGDIFMGAGSNVLVWSFAGIAASLPIPFINAGQNMILYERVPDKMQGRLFAVRNAIQYSTIPIGILLGGLLADYVFEPFMQLKNSLTTVLCHIVGSGAGSGMSLMFLCTGTLGSLFCLTTYYFFVKKALKSE